jgi:hypothetical protein
LDTGRTLHDSGDITENNCITENSNIPDKIKVNILHLETATRQMKNNKSPGYAKLITAIIKAAEPAGTQWIYRVLMRTWAENKIPEAWCKGIIIPIYKKEEGNNVEITEKSCCCVRHSKFMRGYQQTK